MKKREEIEEKYKADLTKFYNSDEDVLKDIEKLTNIVEKLYKYENKILSSSDTFYKFLKDHEEYEKLLNKIYIYYYFKYDLDLTNTKIKEAFDKFNNLHIKWSEHLAFISIETSKMTPKLWNKFKSENKKLEEYDYYVKDIMRYRLHKLKPRDQRFIAKLYPVFGSNEEVYDILTNADAKFDSVKVNGKLEELNEGNLRSFLLNEDREVRKNAYENILKYYEEHKYTISELYKRFIRETNTVSKLHKFNNTLESEMFNSGLNVNIYDTLVKFIKSKSDVNKKITKLFKKELGLDEVYQYDLYYTKYSSGKYEYEDGIKIIENALSVLGKEYVDVFKSGIKDRWIDVYPTLHKNSMQYNIGSAGVSPLIHINYNETFDDISTIAHEMGHAIHYYLSNKYSPFIYADATILATEVASITNEMILNNYVLNNSNNDEEKLFILNQIMQNLKGTVFSQVLLAEFEETASLLDSKDEVLSLDVFTKIYDGLLNDYNGGEVKRAKNVEYAWMRIPHLYAGNGFYVYKYAVDFLMASSIAKNILDGNEDMKKKYLNFLKSGSSKPDIELFKELGFDITKTKYMEDAFKLFENYINMYEELLKKHKK